MSSVALFVIILNALYCSTVFFQKDKWRREQKAVKTLKTVMQLCLHLLRFSANPYIYSISHVCIYVQSLLMKCTLQLGYTGLHQAAQQGHVLVINLLLKHNASPNALNEVSQSQSLFSLFSAVVDAASSLRFKKNTVIFYYNTCFG